MTRFWAIPVAALGGWLVAFVWDLADGTDQTPPWGNDDCDA